MWFIDLPLRLSKADAALFASPFIHLANTPDKDGKMVHELREASGSSSDTYPWWQPWRPRPKMRSRIERLSRYIVTGETAEYRIFVWLAYPVLPDKNLIVIPREDDLMFGLLKAASMKPGRFGRDLTFKTDLATRIQPPSRLSLFPLG
jgi:hypothetical protein